MDQRFDWKQPIRANIIKLRILGLWPYGDESYKLNLYTVWSIVCILGLNLAQNIFQIVNIIFIFDDLQAVISNIFLTLSEILSTLKAYYVVQNMKILKQLMVTLSSDIFQPRNQRQIELIKPSLLFWKVNYILYWSVTLGALFFLSTYPIFDKSSKKYHLPFMAWYPVDTKSSPAYEIIYVYQTLATVCSASTALSVDNLITALNVYIGAQFDILYDNVQNLKNGKKSYNSTLIECIEHHKAIVQFADNTNKFSNWIILAQFFTSAVSIGFTMFQLTVVTPFSSEFFSLISFLSSITTEIFMFCWYGNEVTLKSNRITYAIFESCWIETPVKVKKNILFFLKRTQKPVRMSALNLFNLSLNTFVAILRASWSYFALLNQVSS